REASPGSVHLREVVVVAPGARLDRLEDPGTVRAGFRAEDPRGGAALIAVFGEVGPGVCAHEVLLRRRVEVRDHADGVVEHVDLVRERVPEEAGDAYGHVDARTAELLERNNTQLRHPSRGVVPLRPDTEKREHLRDVVAAGAHGARSPDSETNRGGIRDGVVEVPLDERVRPRLSRLPRRPRPYDEPIDGDVITPRREYLAAPA